MKISLFISFFTVAAFMPAAAALTLDELGSAMASIPVCSGQCAYEVMLPSRTEPVNYDIRFESFAPETRNDSLAPCDYLVDWTLDTPSGKTAGFSAYFSGEHYRYREGRLQEYHYAEDSASFAPRGTADSGVQCRAQFADLLPQFVGNHFCRMAADPSYVYTLSDDTITDGRRSIVVRGTRRISGYDCMEYVYVLDFDSRLPRRISFENNPGQISEQSIEACYSDLDFSAPTASLCQHNLIERYPDAFGRFRESTFSLQNLPGRKLPAFRAYTLASERYHHAANSPFGHPVVVAFLESGVGTTPAVVEAVRSAVKTLPLRVDIIWAFLDKRAEDVEDIMGQEGIDGEIILTSCGGFARDCGVGSTTPVLLFCAGDSCVVDLVIGFNKDLASLVMKKTVLSAIAPAVN